MEPCSVHNALQPCVSLGYDTVSLSSSPMNRLTLLSPAQTASHSISTFSIQQNLPGCARHRGRFGTSRTYSFLPGQETRCALNPLCPEYRRRVAEGSRSIILSSSVLWPFGAVQELLCSGCTCREIVLQGHGHGLGTAVQGNSNLGWQRALSIHRQRDGHSDAGSNSFCQLAQQVAQHHLCQSCWPQHPAGPSAPRQSGGCQGTLQKTKDESRA